MRTRSRKRILNNEKEESILQTAIEASKNVKQNDLKIRSSQISEIQENKLIKKKDLKKSKNTNQNEKKFNLKKKKVIDESEEFSSPDSS